MKKLHYLNRLRLVARWMLSPGEADEVIADYADILDGDLHTDETLYRDFGRPWRAVGVLCQPKVYHNWLILFCLMAACLLLPFCSTLFHWYNSFTRFWGLDQFMLLGAAFLLALLGFWRFGAQKGQLSPSFFVLAVFLVLLGACVLLMTAVLFSPSFLQWAVQLQNERSLRVGLLYGSVLELAALFSTLSGLWSLVQARISDRRWRALFLLSLTVLLAALSLLRILKNMSLDSDDYSWKTWYATEAVLLAVLGLAGTGVLLC